MRSGFHGRIWDEWILSQLLHVGDVQVEFANRVVLSDDMSNTRRISNSEPCNRDGKAMHEDGSQKGDGLLATI